MTYTLHHGDCLDILRTMPDNSVDAIVTDPPYGLSFMGKRWDYDVPSQDIWAECLRVLKPGGHLLAFAGTRTQHRMAVRIEDAGFEIRDMIAWVYGSGFPKSMDVSKAIDKAAGAERETWEEPRNGGGVKRGQAYEGGFEQVNGVRIASAPATDAAKQWHGWGTALKPSTEPLTIARKPLDWRGLCLSLAQYITEETCQYSAGAKDAGPSSASSQSEFAVDPSDFALWSAVEKCNTPGDLFALMDTLPSGLMIPTTLSTVFSWLRTLDGLLKHESTFTTETVSSLTTDLKTLNSLLSKNTQGTIIAELTEANGRGSSAELVACIFSACDASLKSTLARSVHASAIAQAQENYLDAGASPSLEPITVARKPLIGTVTENVLTWGTGGVNVDGCRVGNGDDRISGGKSGGSDGAVGEWGYSSGVERPSGGRWPANLIHDGSEEVVGLFPDNAGGRNPHGTKQLTGERTGKEYQVGELHPNHQQYLFKGLRVQNGIGYTDSGSAARFFYCAKASKRDRDEGCEGMKAKARPTMGNGIGGQPDQGKPNNHNHHPTVKPTDLMRYLCRLVTPPGGTVLDPFMGSGSTGKAATIEGFNFVGIEREAEYLDIARARIEHAKAHGWTPDPEPVIEPTEPDEMQLSLF